MPHLTPLDQLREDFAALTRRPPNSMSIDQRRSVTFYLTEAALVAGVKVPPLTPARTVQWLRALADLEVFLAREGRWPRENNRLERNAISEEERRLAVWVRTQRATANDEALCEYQLRRLECVPGFQQRPLDERWDKNVLVLQMFVTDYRRAPAIRSDDPGERRLAAFAAKQRLAYRRRTLVPTRISSLERLEFWTWGTPPKR
ncbi:helicase associated domain-containing protein [Lacisediminihabitans sp. FW035]